MKELNIASMIDHTLLKANTTYDELKKHCQEAIHYSFAAVAVNTSNISFAVKQLTHSSVKVCAPIGFPLGAIRTDIKVAETIKAIDDGATEVDMVINIGALKSGDYALVKDDIAAVINTAKNKALTKVILENCFLTDTEKEWGCNCAKECGANFVKTSTGLQKGGATVHDVLLMKKTVGDSLEVKAAGGISDLDKALSLIEAGATRLGTSSSVNIVEQFLKNKASTK